MSGSFQADEAQLSCSRTPSAQCLQLKWTGRARIKCLHCMFLRIMDSFMSQHRLGDVVQMQSMLDGGDKMPR